MKISQVQYLTHDLAHISHAEQAEKVCKAGIRWIQFRSKKLNGDDFKRAAFDTKAVCIQFGATLIINDNVAVAKELNTGGVHLGKSDMSIAEARILLGNSAIIGGTANTEDDIIELIRNGVHYIGLGPFIHTTTKANLSPVLGPEKITELSNRYLKEIPIIAIGGIQLKDAEMLFKNGIYGIAVSSAIHGAEDPESAASQFIKLSKPILEWKS